MKEITFMKRKYRVDKEGRPVFGVSEDGERQYWPEVARLTLDIPPPLEQYLERLAREGHLGERPEDVALYLLREGIMDKFTRHGRQKWLPDPWRYMKRKPRAKPSMSAKS